MHRIRRQILELELPREAGAAAMQSRVSRVFQEQVLPRLEEAFTRIALADRIVRIDRLELDLGNISEADWEREFVRKCVEQISRQVAEAAFAVGDEQPAETFSAAENALAVFRYFLETGRLPWYAKHLTLSALEEMVSAAMAGRSTFREPELLRILQGHPDALQRMVWQFPLAFSGKIMEAVLDLPAGWMEQAILLRQSQTGQALLPQEWLALAQYLLDAETLMLKSIPPTPAMLAQLFLKANPAGTKPPKSKPTSASQPPSGRPAAGSASDPAQSHGLPRASVGEPPVRAKAARSKTEPEGMLVDDAGLVLLAVYLPPFFNKLGLDLLDGQTNASIEKEQQEETGHRAVHLLHYLARGQERPEEPWLEIPKILCGLALEVPVPQVLYLSDEEKLEAHRLLEAIIRNWPALKSTSPDGLRAGFLRRSGLLSWSESRQSWLLRVERLGQDLLLERIPWSYSVIKLPWMKEMVAVEW